VVSLKKCVFARNNAEGKHLSDNEEQHTPVCRFESCFPFHLHYYVTTSQFKKTCLQNSTLAVNSGLPYPVEPDESRQEYGAKEVPPQNVARPVHAEINPRGACQKN